jgi:prepilin-type N-terminal cleavage/methylation domain-containing protein
MRRGFSLIEVMVALGLGAVIAATVVATFSSVLGAQGRSKREWEAFTIAEQQLELLASLPSDAGLLAPNSNSTAPGAAADRRCDDIPAGPQHFRTNGLGDVRPSGAYDVCIKVTAGNPFGGLRNVRVVALYEFGGTDGVLLQTIR